MKYSRYNVVIIGSGISGLHLANKLSENPELNEEILIITKDKLFSGSSALAQGGIVSVIPEINPKDSIESHVKDTIVSGCGINNINVVRYVSEQSAQAIDDLIRYGVKFDKTDGKLNFTLEGAHSCPRILHSFGDSTGRIIEKTLCERLLSKNSVEVYENTMAVEILTDEKEVCRGVIVYNHELKAFETIFSNCVIVATGGVGQLYKTTTNPDESTGDGIYLAHLSGAELENMEFVQFHPTALYCKGKKTTPLVSESVRGEGAKLVNQKGEYFAKNYHPKADLAPRDVVARAILNELTKNNDEYVNLDISQIGIEKFKQRFPTITALCEENNVDISSSLIPVVPAEHYFMGGIKTDASAKTTIENLYAIGECASTGLHGANRLASNSLLECVVFANTVCKYILKNLKCPPKKNDTKIKNLIEKYSQIVISDEHDDFLKNKFEILKSTMTSNVGILRSEESLKEAEFTILSIKSEITKITEKSKIAFELIGAIDVALAIISSAIKRKNSIGAHFRQDFALKPDIEQKYKDIAENDKIHA